MSNTPEYPDANDVYQPTVHDASSGQTDYTFSWPYIGQADYDGSTSPYVLVAHVSDEGSRTYPSFSMPTSSSIRLATAVSEGRIIIMRQSWTNGLLVDFAAGATLSESQLDLAIKQAYYLWEESVSISLDSYQTNNDDAKFNALFTFSGDGSTTGFRLTNSSYTINEEPGEIAIWAFVGGSFVQSADYSIYQDSDEVVVVDFDRAPETGEYIEIRVAQVQALSAAIADGQIDCQMLADGAICDLDKFDLDDEGTARYVLGWDGSVAFGARALTHDDISDFDSEVEAKRLDQFAAPTANVSLGSHKLTDVVDPTSDQDGATKKYVDDSISDALTSTAVFAGTVTVTGSAGFKTITTGSQPRVVFVKLVPSIGGTVEETVWLSDIPATLTPSSNTTWRMEVTSTSTSVTFTANPGSSSGQAVIEYCIVTDG